MRTANLRSSLPARAYRRPQLKAWFNDVENDGESTTRTETILIRRPPGRLRPSCGI